MPLEKRLGISKERHLTREIIGRLSKVLWTTTPKGNYQLNNEMSNLDESFTARLFVPASYGVQRGLLNLLNRSCTSLR